MNRFVIGSEMGRRLPALFAFVAFITMSACERAGSGSGPFSVTDSAGVRIVETASLASADSTDWSVDTTAMVSIGVFEGADPYVFGDIAGATRDGQGRIIIADRQANEIRFFS